MFICKKNKIRYKNSKKEFIKNESRNKKFLNYIK